MLSKPCVIGGKGVQAGVGVGAAIGSTANLKLPLEAWGCGLGDGVNAPDGFGWLGAPRKLLASNIAETEIRMIDRLICNEAARSDFGPLFTRLGFILTIRLSVPGQGRTAATWFLDCRVPKSRRGDLISPFNKSGFQPLYSW